MKPVLLYIQNRAVLKCLLLVLEQLLQRGCTQVFLATDDPGVEPYSRGFGKDLSARFMSMETAAQYRWAAIVSTHIPPETARLQGPLMIVTHGLGFGIGGMYSVVLAQNSTVYFGHTPNEYEYLKKSLGRSYNKDRFVATGCPAVDELAQCLKLSDSDKCELKISLGLDPQLPVILVSSHWTPDSILRTWGSGALAALESFTSQYNIVQIAHAGIWDYPCYDTYDARKGKNQPVDRFDSKKLFDELTAYCANRDRVHFMPYANTQKLLGISDLLIGDYSSIIVEFCALSRPVVFTDRSERFV